MLFRIAMIVLLALSGRIARADDDELRERIDDKNGVRTDVWVYNDISEARDTARKENKPVFVTFRCVPCKDCAAFDAEVANGSDRVAEFAKEKFVSVRQVEMKGVDLSLFQFDHDLNWAAMFINADGTVYARYGTQSAEGADAYNSVDGLLKTMQRVLDLHADYPNNKAQLAGKRGHRKIKSALDMPGLQNPEKLRKQTTRGNCIHCHNIHDAEHAQAYADGTFSNDMLWRYPLPDNVGLKIDPVSGVTVAEVVPDSPAAKAGIEAGEDVLTMNGQPMTSIADMQWVLHHIPAKGGSVDVKTSRTGSHSLELESGWKVSDISWRGSIWSVSPRLRVWSPILAYDRRKALGVSDDDTAFEVKWINKNQPGGAAALKSGLRVGDVLIELEGKPLRMNNQQFNAYIKLHYKVGQEVPVTVLRDGKRKAIRIKLVE